MKLVFLFGDAAVGKMTVGHNYVYKEFRTQQNVYIYAQSVWI